MTSTDCAVAIEAAQAGAAVVRARYGKQLARIQVRIIAGQGAAR